jgi:hypothetical protein
MVLRSATSQYHPGPSASRGQKLTCMASCTLFAFTSVPWGSIRLHSTKGTSWGRSRDSSAPLRNGLSVKKQGSYEVIEIDICPKVWSMFMGYLSIISDSHIGTERRTQIYNEEENQHHDAIFHFLAFGPPIPPLAYLRKSKSSMPH